VRKACAEVLLLPLRESEQDRFLRTDRRADATDDFGGEAGAGAAVPAPAILTAIGLVPEEAVEEIAVGAMDRDAVEAQRHRLGR
jgi:hypothetical protein